MRHTEVQVREDVTVPLGDPIDVGDEALRLAQLHFRGEIIPDDRFASALICRCSGLLIYGMEYYGLGYEAICQAADPAVANVLQAISPDIRLPTSRRTLELKIRTANADAQGQLVRLAEITCAAKVASFLPDDVVLAQAHDLKRWCDERDELLGVLNRIAARERLKPAFATARNYLKTTRRRADELRRSKPRTRESLV